MCNSILTANRAFWGLFLTGYHIIIFDEAGSVKNEWNDFSDSLLIENLILLISL